MKPLLFLLFLTTIYAQSQEYVDLFRIGYGQTFNNNFEGTSSSTQVDTFEADLIFPLPLSATQTLITGGSFSKNRLQLFPEAAFSNLFSTTLKLGLVSTYSSKWSSTMVLLPKLASDYQNITSDDLYFGGFALLKYQKKENLLFRFGAYGSQEAFGIFATPIFGWYYISDNGKFEMDMSLPIAADINYTFGAITVGMDYFGIGRSFNITEENVPESYVDLSSLEFAGYVQFNTYENSVLLRAKLGYSSNDYEVYTQEDNIDFGISAFSFGDDRIQLNPTINGGVFLKFEAIYRFQLSKKEEEIEAFN